MDGNEETRSSAERADKIRQSGLSTGIPLPSVFAVLKLPSETGAGGYYSCSGSSSTLPE